MRLTYGAALLGAFFFLAPPQALAATSTVKLGELAKPTCASAVFDDATGKCGPPPKLDKFDKDTCPSAAGFSFDGKCKFDPAQSKPECSTVLGRLAYDPETKSCVLVVNSPTSAPGSYVGDCFTVVGDVEGTLFKSGDTYAVTNQRREANDERTLTMVKGDVNLVPIPFYFGCKARGGKEVEVPAGRMMASGAKRYGWAYGFLTMPYKYYPSAKEFQVGVPIGSYLGYRVGQAGSGYTWAAAVTLGQVKADTLDPKLPDPSGKPTVTGTTDVAALSWALGMVFDVSKEPATKGFKAGVFVGQDRVNRSPSIEYKHNGKTWVAIQVGYDFTDN